MIFFQKNRGVFVRCEITMHKKGGGCFGMRQPLGPIREETANPRCFPESHGLPKPLAWCDMRHRRELSPHCAVPGLILEQAMPEFKSLSRPFSPPACFCHAPKEGEGLVSLESPAPYGGILTTRVVRIPPRISSPSVRCLTATLSFRFGIPHHRGSLRTFTAVRISRRSYQESSSPYSWKGAF